MASDPLAVPISHALEAWGVVCKALGRERQVVLLRRGGRREESPVRALCSVAVAG
jgi:hypothetical protein